MRKFDLHASTTKIISKIREMAVDNGYKPRHVLTEYKFFEDDPLRHLLSKLPSFSQRLNSDLSKVKFDWENCTSGTSLSDMAWNENNEDIFGYSKDIIGPHNQMKGISWIGCAAGGDWEVPIFFILYMDQGTVRAWIPKEGNCWNRSTKKAFGNDSRDVFEVIRQLKKLKSDIFDDWEAEEMIRVDYLNYVKHLQDSYTIRQSIQSHFAPRKYV